jgi:DNA-binding NarL/FixJ family response regulator
VERIRVLLADDHPIVRSGMYELLQHADDIIVVGQASTGHEAMQLVAELAPDVLLLDMELPGMNGLEVAAQLRANNASVQVLALSAYNDQPYIVGVLARGAAGYLTKDEAPQMIVEAVRGVARGEQGWLSRRASAQLVAHTREGEVKQPTLTPRELEVMRLVVDGKKNQEIGVTLQISEKTVQKHLGEVFTKLGVGSRVQAAVYVVRNKLV